MAAQYGYGNVFGYGDSVFCCLPTRLPLLQDGRESPPGTQNRCTGKIRRCCMGMGTSLEMGILYPVAGMGSVISGVGTAWRQSHAAS